VTIETWCPECGYGVKIDEEGCCISCGVTAIGKGVDQALAAEAERKALLREKEQAEQRAQAAAPDALVEALKHITLRLSQQVPFYRKPEHDGWWLTDFSYEQLIGNLEAIRQDAALAASRPERPEYYWSNERHLAEVREAFVAGASAGRALIYLPRDEAERETKKAALRRYGERKDGEAGR
jgi:hypothetical protein